MKGLRWYATVRTVNGAITTAVRVRASTAQEAADNAEQKAWCRYWDNPDYLHRYRIGEWRCIMVSLHEDDQNKLRPTSED